MHGGDDSAEQACRHRGNHPGGGAPGRLGLLAQTCRKWNHAYRGRQCAAGTPAETGERLVDRQELAEQVAVADGRVAEPLGKARESRVWEVSSTFLNRRSVLRAVPRAPVGPHSSHPTMSTAHPAHANILAFVLVAAVATPYAVHAQVAAPTALSVWSAVDAAMGRSGVAQPGDVQRYNFPRGDLRVTVTGAGGPVLLKPSFALGGWIAMHRTGVGDAVMAMGDLVLTDDEVTPVMMALQAGGVEQSAVHHHVLRESPRVLYMHVHAMGDAVAIARTIRAAVALTKAPAPALAATTPPPLIDLDTAAVTKALGYAGRMNGGVYQVSVPRMEVVRDGGMEIPSSMGLGTAINFQPTGAGKAAITGDFVLLAAEVNPVIKTLLAHGIDVTSLHNHLLTDEPRLFFMHFWANADAVTLAHGLRAALDQTNVRRPVAR